MNNAKISLKTKTMVALLRALSFPKIPDSPKKGKWYQIPLPQCISGNRGPCHGSLRIGTENKLMVMFHGGGVSWNEYMAARPNTIYMPLEGDNFYTLDGHLIADVVTGHGISSRKKTCPFRNWSVISIPYGCGDFHCGTGDYSYTALDGSQQILHHHGYINYRAVMKAALKYIGTEPRQLMVTGFSAGGFGTALLTDDVMSFFPKCEDVLCYVDSGFMLYEGWHDVAVNVWKTPEEICDRLHSDDITLDSLQALKKKHGSRVKILFSCSVRDAALAEFWTYITEGRLYAGKETGIAFQKDLEKMCGKMIETIPDAGIFIFDMPIEGKVNEEKRTAGLTQHCISLSKLAETVRVDGKTVQQWLWNAANGKTERIGLSLLNQYPDASERRKTH